MMLIKHQIQQPAYAEASSKREEERGQAKAIGLFFGGSRDGHHRARARKSFGGLGMVGWPRD
jgi:hypothetical protein